MKLTTLLLIITLMEVSAASFGQTLTMKENSVPLEKVLLEVRKQTGYDVLIFTTKFKTTGKISVNFRNAPLAQVMDQVTQGTDFSYTIEDKNIVIKEKSKSFLEKFVEVFNQVDVRGQVVNEDGKPLMGANIKIKGTNKSVIAGAGGVFNFSRIDDSATLVVSYLGYTTQEIKLKKDEYVLVVKMAVAENKMDDVIITGTGINRKKESFTGSTSSFTGEQLKAVGNRNVLESLKTLDPSFVIVDNNLQGSNPNSLPSIEVRGKTSININAASVNDQFKGDPNQPLFILDGFESDLQTIYDLDMNRIGSITLLKDAASTALYGSKAANGVVVVETKKPVPGELRIGYSADFSFDLPDLSGYNLMNAAEKLQFEKLAGVYYTPNSQWAADSLYNARLAQVQRGVNTYWLSVPVQTGFTERHSLNISGGSNELLFTAGVNYRDQTGVMKGSDRNTWGSNFDLTYRKGKFNITNIVTLSNLNSNESPYGSFTNFAQAVPYYSKYNPDGSIPMYLGNATNLPNPLYNASLFSINQTKSFNFQNNLQGIYTVSNEFRILAGLSLAKGNGTGVVFIPPDNTQFSGTPTFQKGSYTNSQSESSSYSGNLTASYSKVINKSQFNASVRTDVQQSTGTFTGFSAVGFPYGTNGNPTYAYGYTPNARPSSSVVTSRNLGILGSVNYAYDQRFLADATYRLDGSSQFGSSKQFKPFASLGFGWNISSEAFLKNVSWVTLLKLRANAGYTGNQNLGSFSSTSIYTFQSGANSFGQGLNLTSLGNPDLDWQKTLQQSYGIDFAFLHNRVSGYVEYFDKSTDPMIVSASGAIPTSVGVNSQYVINVGKLKTTGLDFNIRFSPVYNLKDRIIWTIGVTGQTTKSAYGGLGNSLSVLNKLALNDKSLTRYQDGNSPDDLWAVVSRGIDPATGNEIFQKKDGTLTFAYSTDDIVKVGNTDPVIQGVINTNFTYKNFNFGANVRYSIGGDVFNSAIYNKVENISASNLNLNQDRRALYDRWQKPGDVAQFKSISLNSSTPMSSRFVEEDTHFIGESFTAGWRVSNGWIRKLKLQSLGISLYVNDIFRLESIQTERGIDYPFARSASISLNASF